MSASTLGVSTTVQPTWDHAVRPQAAPRACRRLSSPPWTTPSGYRGPYHHATASHTAHTGWRFTRPLAASSGVASQPLLSLLSLT
ncbi:hypothetical protein PCASD_14458 [Puccinia coronata f. sp. avenae]|uniref:Uncharacterized protein n=1 Tax=Puccinia coronata f. sp. avenae TaxID=200324 RepID=A0A2N5UDK7_9BASI|nr:hypothetical protein PCASD_14458 [Puccinia coronata f. sp. avenae]